MEDLIFIGNYAYLVEAELTASEFGIMVNEIYYTGNVQETTVKYGAKIVSCFLMN